MHVEIEFMKFWCELEKEKEDVFHFQWIVIVLIMVQHLIDFKIHN